MLMEWGQFLAHDVVGTPVGELLDRGDGGGCLLYTSDAADER